MHILSTALHNPAQGYPQVPGENGLSLASLLLGTLLAAAIAYAAYRVGSLSTTGAVAAVAVGILTFGIGGLAPAVLMILFFVSSTALSRMGGDQKRGVALAFAKGGRRDAGQVAANGGIAAILSVGFGVTGEPFWLAGIVGALAAANADTWATELGVLSRSRPRLITSGAVVEPGTSGAITVAGTAAALGGAALIALAAWLLTADAAMALGAAVGGLVGSLFDSLLGATIQAMYYCPACGKETERHPLHGCGTPTQRVRGWGWLDNDAVNLAATACGGLLTMAIWAIFPGSSNL